MTENAFLFLLKSFVGRMWQPLLAPNRQIFFNTMSKEFFWNLEKSLYKVPGLTVLGRTQKSQWQFVSNKSFSLHSFIQNKIGNMLPCNWNSHIFHVSSQNIRGVKQIESITRSLRILFSPSNKLFLKRKGRLNQNEQ